MLSKIGDIGLSKFTTSSSSFLIFYEFANLGKTLLHLITDVQGKVISSGITIAEPDIK